MSIKPHQHSPDDADCLRVKFFLLKNNRSGALICDISAANPTFWINQKAADLINCNCRGQIHHCLIAKIIVVDTIQFHFQL